MRRMYYVSRFARPLTNRDLEDIHEKAVRYNRRARITGILVCLGDTFFQVLEGPSRSVERLYNERILLDPRHKDVMCIKTETGVSSRRFPGWHMQVFNLNESASALPIAFQQMLTALLEASQTIAFYSPPSVTHMIERGLDPTLAQPRQRRVTVLYSDIIGFSRFAERLHPDEMIPLVNSHIKVCTTVVEQFRGEVNKLTGDGVLAYFTDRTTDNAVRAAMHIVRRMRQNRARANKNSAHRLLYGGVGLAHGSVYEGNVGVATTRDFTILGNVVNLAARLESLTRQLNVRLALDESVVRRASSRLKFLSLGRHDLRGQSQPTEVFTVKSLPKLRVGSLYSRIDSYSRQKR